MHLFFREWLRVRELETIFKTILKLVTFFLTIAMIEEGESWNHVDKIIL